MRETMETSGNNCGPSPAERLSRELRADIIHERISAAAGLRELKYIASQRFLSVFATIRTSIKRSADPIVLPR